MGIRENIGEIIDTSVNQIKNLSRLGMATLALSGIGYAVEASQAFADTTDNITCTGSANPDTLCKESGDTIDRTTFDNGNTNTKVAYTDGTFDTVTEVTCPDDTINDDPDASTGLCTTDYAGNPLNRPFADGTHVSFTFNSGGGKEQETDFTDNSKQNVVTTPDGNQVTIVNVDSTGAVTSENCKVTDPVTHVETDCANTGTGGGTGSGGTGGTGETGGGTGGGNTGGGDTGPSAQVIEASLAHDQTCVNEAVAFDSSPKHITSTGKHPQYSYQNYVKKVNKTRAGKAVIKLPAMSEIDPTCHNVELTVREQIKESPKRDMKHARNISSRFTILSSKENDGKAHDIIYKRSQVTGKEDTFARLEFYATTADEYTGARVASSTIGAYTKPQKASKTF